MKILFVNGRQSAKAFGRTDLLVVVGVVGILAFLGTVYIAHASTKSKTAICMNSLKQLGFATDMYSQANQQKLPYAMVHRADTNQSSWDRLLNPFLRASLRGKDMSVPPPSQAKVNELLLCPEDTVKPIAFAVKYKLPRRTYSMPWHDMNKANWPPASTNATGIGLWWAAYGRDLYSIEALDGYSNNIPAFKKDMILDPAATLLLTEQAKPNNIAGNTSGARIKCTADHLEAKVIEPSDYHDGKINYLMVDGHVETLLPAQTVGHTGQAGNDPRTHLGMWTVRPGD